MIESADRAAVRSLFAGDSREPVRMPMLSGSMAKTILPGDMLTVRPVSGHSIHTGDVAVFIKNGILTAHRVIFVFRCGLFSILLEMGDQNQYPGLLSEQAVLGTVTAVERNGLAVHLDTGTRARRTAQAQFARVTGRLLFGTLIKKARRLDGRI